MWKKILPSLVLLSVLLLLGAGLYLFSDAEARAQISWGGFLSMLFFYALVFFAGSYIASGKKQSDTDTDVMLAGRALPLWISVFTMSATWIGGGYINGTAEATYAGGLMWVQAPWGYALSLILGGLLFARRMRRYGFRTMLDPLQQRFGQGAASLLFLPALVGEIFWSAAILVALGTTFAAVLGLGFELSIILSAAIILVYTIIGGLWAVALTDVIQLSLLILGLCITVPFCISALGGWDYVWTSYLEKNPDTSSFFPDAAVLGSQWWTWWDYAFLLVFGGIPWQVYFQRVLAARDEQTAVRLSIIAGFVCLAVAVPAILIGMAGSVADWSSTEAARVPEGAEILPFVMRYLTNPWVATIGLGAVAAAVMASADSSILSAASMGAWNIYKPFMQMRGKPLSSKQLVTIIRRGIVLMGLVITFIALNIKSVAVLWILSSDLVYCLLFPALFAAFFDKKANRYGVLAGFFLAAFLRLGGGEAALGLPAFLPYPILDPAQELIEGKRVLVLLPFRTIAAATGLVTIFIVSRLSQPWQKARALYKVEEEALNEKSPSKSA